MPCFFYIFSCFGSTKIIEIGSDLRDLQSHVHCYVLGTTAKCRFWFFQLRCAHKWDDVINFITIACRNFSRLKWYKNCKNRLSLAKVIVKNKMSRFLWFSVYFLLRANITESMEVPKLLQEKFYHSGGRVQSLEWENVCFI